MTVSCQLVILSAFTAKKPANSSPNRTKSSTNRTKTIVLNLINHVHKLSFVFHGFNVGIRTTDLIIYSLTVYQ